MTGGSVEATLELWASSLRTVKERIRPVFRQDRTAAAAGLFLDALLGPERRKTGWMRAEAAGDPGPWRQQALLDRSRWEADALRDLVRDTVSGRWTRVEDSWAVAQRVGWWAVSRGGEPWRGLLLI
jgi:SRSO17 transposase